MNWWARVAGLLRWIFATTPTCSRADCTKAHLCDDCAAFWSIK